MKMFNIEDFYATLFDPEDYVCWSPNPYGVQSRPVTDLMNSTANCFFSINPLKGKRCDANVTSYRNILLEFDTISLTEQLKLIATIPHSTLVYSGGKSYHAIISLEEACATKDDYDKLVRRIYDRLPDVDKSAKNPSRFSRAPGAKRDSGAVQDLIEVKEQVTRNELEAWLGPDVIEEAYSIGNSDAAHSQGRLNANTLWFLADGAEEGKWNKHLFMAALDLARCGRSEENIMETCAKVTGKLDNSDKRTIRSAIGIVLKEQNG